MPTIKGTEPGFYVVEWGTCVENVLRGPYKTLFWAKKKKTWYRKERYSMFGFAVRYWNGREWIEPE